MYVADEMKNDNEDMLLADGLSMTWESGGKGLKMMFTKF